MATIARSGSANLLGAGVSAIANFGLIVLVSRMWSLEIAGSLFAVTSVFLIALVLSQLGVDQGLVRFLAWNTALAKGGENRLLAFSGVAAAVLASAAVLALGLITAEPLAALLGGVTSNGPAQKIIVVFACALPVAAVYETLLALTRGMSTMRPTIVFERLMRPSLQLGGVGAAGLLGADATGLAMAWALPYAIGLSCVLVSLRRIVRANPGAFAAGFAVDTQSTLGAFWKFTIPRGLARLAQVCLQRADIALVVIIAGPVPGAVYTAATRFLVLGQLATSAIQQTSEPQLARLLALDDHLGARLVARRLTLWALLLAWPIYLMIAVYAGFFLELFFGAPYGDGASVLKILALAMLFATAMGPLDVLLLMAGRSSLSLFNTTTALLIDVAGCLLLIPLWGITGAAAAWAAAIAAKNVLCFVQVHRTIGVSPFSRELAAMTAILVPTFGVLPWLLHHILQIQPQPEIVVMSIAAVGYLLFLWLRRKPILSGPFDASYTSTTSPDAEPFDPGSCPPPHCALQAPRHGKDPQK